MPEPTVLRTARLDQAGNWRGLVQVVHHGQVVHHRLCNGRPDREAAQRDANRYEPPWDDLDLDTSESTTSAEVRQNGDGPPADPKEQAAARVKAAFDEHEHGVEALADAKRAREVACLEAFEAGLTYVQIAEMVGTSHQTISQLARRERVRREAEEEQT